MVAVAETAAYGVWVRVPDRMSAVGCDGIALPGMAAPWLTTVSVP